DRKLKYIVFTAIISVLIMLLFGIPSALIPNSYYYRMIPPTPSDYFFLITISVLLAIYIAVNFYYKKSNETKSYYLAGFTGFASIFIVTCSICNMLLVAILGTSFAYYVFDPLKPLLGLILLSLLLVAIWLKVKGCKQCNAALAEAKYKNDKLD
ncbi:MAG: hypothetical protein AABW72_04125, partial [archaeon]